MALVLAEGGEELGNPPGIDLRLKDDERILLLPELDRRKATRLSSVLIGEGANSTALPAEEAREGGRM